jgi:uncharacterized protein (TIGR02145 family)
MISFIFNIMKRQGYFWLIILMITGFALPSCKKESNLVSPTVTSYSPFFLSSSTATVGFRVVSDGGSKILDCGIYIGLAANPETGGTKLSVASDTGTYVFQVNGLVAGTQFYMKSYAKNSRGDGLSDQITFTTPSKIKDYDNNSYETVSIANQLWMSENLKATHFQNGDPLGTTTVPAFDISGESTPKYQWSYNGDDAFAAIYGKLYTYYAITDSRKICPAGWHIPTDTEWMTLESALGGYTIAGSSLKEAGTSHWISPYNSDATNASCFKALPGGYRNSTIGANTFSYIWNYGYWWSATEGDAGNAWVRTLFVQSTQISRISFGKKGGASVRCLKD